VGQEENNKLIQKKSPFLEGGWGWVRKFE
jgi:hypothetical protein